MTVDEKKEWLNRYKESVRRADEIAKDIADYSYLKGLRFEPVSIRNTHSRRRDLSNDVIDLDELKRDYIKECTHSLRVYREIFEALSCLEYADDPDEYDIIFMKYLQLKTFETISVEIGCVLRTTYKKHKRALEHFDVDTQMILKNATEKKEREKQG